ncbi:MAG: hypothetical protein KAI62_04875 [Actinomycetia bacterium]|nr:hypothetical protein [Actinomycetes bacterium]
MKKVIKIMGRITLALAILSLGGLIYNLIFYEKIRPLMLRFEDISAILDKMQIPVAASFMLIFIFHVSAVLYIFFQIMFFKRENLTRALLFFLAIISILMVLGDFALLSDMGKEHAAGLDTSGEWPVLYASHALHLVFIILLFILIFMTRKKVLAQYREDIVLRDEAIFINTQYIGIFSGFFGIGVFAALSAFTPLWALKKGIFIVSLIAVLPYLLIAAYWLIVKIREKTGQWYDEKQYLDISRASLFTMVVSIVVMTAIFVIQYFSHAFEFMTITWWPFYVFLVLLLFSGSTLYYAKRAV